jgi:hypothetical protein
MKKGQARAEIFPWHFGRSHGFGIRWIGPKGRAKAGRFYFKKEQAHEIAQLCGASTITDVAPEPETA